MTSPHDLAYDLIGTCRTCIVEEELETSHDVDVFYMLAFECEDCGWWYSTEELNNIGPRELCDSCHEDADDCPCGEHESA